MRLGSAGVTPLRPHLLRALPVLAPVLPPAAAAVSAGRAAALAAAVAAGGAGLPLPLPLHHHHLPLGGATLGLRPLILLRCRLSTWNFDMIEMSDMFDTTNLESVRRPGGSWCARANVLQTGKDTA